MPDKVTYYAVVDNFDSRERPAGVFRRIYTQDGGRSDEVFTRNLNWEFSPELISAERGDLQYELIEITEEEANQIVERIRAKVTGASNGDEIEFAGRHGRPGGQLIALADARCSACSSPCNEGA